MDNELEITLQVLCQSLKTTLALLLTGSGLTMATTKVDKWGKMYKVGKKNYFNLLVLLKEKILLLHYNLVFLSLLLL